MLFKEWEVLLVDDEPDVLEVSKLAMSRIEIYGLPLKIHTAASKAEALELFKKSPSLVPTLSVAFVDVVMESDEAGLELCQEIREGLNNDVTQLYIRTGQPGNVPEREVMDRYDINGYFTKTEMTADKLYSMVKSGVRQFLWSWGAQALGGVLTKYIMSSGSREQLAKARDEVAEVMFSDEGGGGASAFNHMYAFWVEDELSVVSGWNSDGAAEQRDRLSEQERVPLGGDGDYYVQDGTNLLMNIAASEDKAAGQIMLQFPYQVPANFITMLHHAQVCFAILWKRAV